jgi:hypothetical protein
LTIVCPTTSDKMVQSNLFERDLFKRDLFKQDFSKRDFSKRDLGLSGTFSYALFTLFPNHDGYEGFITLSGTV